MTLCCRCHDDYRHALDDVFLRLRRQCEFKVLDERCGDGLHLNEGEAPTCKKAHIESSPHDADRPSEYLTYATTDTSSYSHASAQDHVSRVDGHTEGEQVRVKADRRHLRLVEVCKAIRIPFVGICAPYLRVTNDMLAHIDSLRFKHWSGIPIV